VVYAGIDVPHNRREEGAAVIEAGLGNCCPPRDLFSNSDVSNRLGADAIPTWQLETILSYASTICHPQVVAQHLLGYGSEWFTPN